MLYDPRWDKPDPVLDCFVAFLRGMPADKSYVYYALNACACAEYCRKTRRLLDWVWPPRRKLRVAHEREVWHRFDTIAAYKPHTFGALLQRMLEQDLPPGTHRFPQW